jgi:hypothetical protein
LVQRIPAKRPGVLQEIKKYREFSSVGLEHLPYKQRVTGSTPVTPTKPDKGFKRYKFETLFHLHKVFLFSNLS